MIISELVSILPSKCKSKQENHNVVDVMFKVLSIEIRFIRFSKHEE